MKARNNLAELPKRLFHFSLQMLRVKTADFEKFRPILVYQMGKVASASVYESLKNGQKQHPVFHVHFLSDKGLHESANHIRNRGMSLPGHWYLGRALNNRLKKLEGVRPITITLVRDPIARQISDVFQNIRAYFPKLAKGEFPPASEIVYFLERYFSEEMNKFDYAEWWLESEIGESFNINVLEQPFDAALGYSCVSNENTDLLIMTLESLNCVFPQATKELLGLQVPLLESNFAADKNYSAVYREVRNRISLPRRLLESIYGRPFSLHFYTKDHLARFTEQWESPG